MIISAKNEDKDYYFSEVDNDNYYPLFDGPKDFLINSLEFIHIKDDAAEETYTNNSIIKFDIPEEINPTDKRSSETFISTNAITSQFFFSMKRLEAY